MCCVLFVVLCIVCCVSQYCVVSTIKCKKMFQRKLYNYVFCVVYCLLCCILFVVYHSTVLCQQSNANFFQQNLIFFKKQKFILFKLLNVFSSVVGFSMSACSVRLMWPSVWWSCCVFVAVTPSFRCPEWAVVPPAVGAHGHVMQPIIKTLFSNRFSQFLLQKIQQ